MTRSVNGTDSTRVRDCKFRTLRRKPSQSKAPTAKRRIQMIRRCGIAGGTDGSCLHLGPRVVRLSPCAPLPTTRRTHSSACLCSTARLANIIFIVLFNDKPADEEPFWDIVLSAWLGRHPWDTNVQYAIDGLECDCVEEEVSDGEGGLRTRKSQTARYTLDQDGKETTEPEGYVIPVLGFQCQEQFYAIRSRCYQRLAPTTQVLKKKFEEFLAMFVPLYRPTDAPDKYAGNEYIYDEWYLKESLDKLLVSKSESEKLATWYLFCVLHSSDVFAREKLGGIVLAHYETK